MRLKIKIASTIFVALTIVSCQKSTITESEKDSNILTLPRAGVPDRNTHYTGFGYDVTGPYATRNGTRQKIIDVDRFHAETGEYHKGPMESRTNKNEFGAYAEEYSRNISNKVSATAGFTLFGASIGGSYSASNQGNHSYDGKYVYAEKVVTIRKRHDAMNATSEQLSRYLTLQFQNHLKTQSPAWIIENYGTHVMKNIYSGGKLFILFRGENTSVERINASRSSISLSSSLLFDLETEITNTEDTRRYNETTNKELYYEMTGGNASISIGSGQVNLQQGLRRMSTAAWQSSVTYENAELVDFADGGLIPIWEVIPDPQKRQEIKNYVESYLRANSTKVRYNTVPIYSLYYTGFFNNTRMRENHLLSMTPTRALFENHGVNFFVFNYQVPGSVPLYEYFHQGWNNSLYTTEFNPQHLLNFGYRLLNQICYVYPRPHTTNGIPSKPVHVYYNPTSVNHHFSTSATTPRGYIKEAPYFHAH